VDLATSTLRVTGAGVRASLAGERVVLADPAAPGGPVTWELPVSEQTFVTGTGVAGTPTHSVRLSFPLSAATTAALGAVRDALLAGRPVHAAGRSRFGTVEVANGARLVTEDDLEVGLVDPPALNSRASLSIDASSRALLRGEAPLITTTTAVPAPGSTIDANTTISLAYGVTDPLGLSLVETTWSLGTGTQTTLLDEALQLTSGPLSLVVPPTQTAGPVSYRIRAVDRAGRVADVTHTWTVRTDTVPPTLVSLELVPFSTNDAYVSGDVVTITVRAADNVAVKRIRMTLDGQTRDFASAVASFVFTAPPVAAQTPFVLNVELLDHAGNTTPVTRTLLVSPAGGPGAPVVGSTVLERRAPARGLCRVRPSGDGHRRCRGRAHRVLEGRRDDLFSTKTPVSGNLPLFVATRIPSLCPRSPAHHREVPGAPSTVRPRPRSAWSRSGWFPGPWISSRQGRTTGARSRTRSRCCARARWSSINRARSAASSSFATRRSRTPWPTPPDPSDSTSRLPEISTSSAAPLST
jgi:hypothetical protein